MRLRQLATTQRVIFFSPPEVHQSITDLCGKKIIKSSDVIRWLLEQSCSGIEQMQPLYFSQGVDFCRRTQGALDNSNFLTQGDQRDAYLDILRQNEQQTLVQLYRPSRPKPTKALGPFAPQIVPLMNELDHRRKGFQDRGDAVHASTLQEVEQEREVAYEVEAIREVQKPVRQSPYSFRGLHKDIMNFVKTGNLAAGDGGYEHAFVALRHTALGQKYNIKSEVIKSKFYLSKEFSRTVLPLGSPNDNFLVSHDLICSKVEKLIVLLQRQVNWILWSVIAETALVLIPEEAEEVIPLLREADRSPTHLLTYAAPVTRKMLHFNDLNYYALPALPTGWKPPTWLAIELAIFAGRLYFNYDEYADLCTYLGIQEDGTKFLDTSEDTALGTDVAGEDGDTANTESKIMDMSTTRESTRSPTFTAKPLTFLQEWLAIRRKGQDFTHTPMGYLCQGKPLKPTHPFFAAPEHEAATAPTTNTIGTTFSGQASRVEAADSETGEFDEEIEDGGDDGYFYDEGRDDGQEEEDEYAMYDEDGDPVE